MDTTQAELGMLTEQLRWAHIQVRATSLDPLKVVMIHLHTVHTI